MTSNKYAFDDFIDDCFLDGDPLCIKATDNACKLSGSEAMNQFLLHEKEIKKP